MNDIHTHLFWESYDADRDAVIRRARDAGVSRMLSVGTSPEDNARAIAVAEKYDDIYASIGLHPHYFNKSGIRNEASREKIKHIKELMESLHTIARHKRVVAIGECGLDYFVHGEEEPITDEQKTFQKEGFLAQLTLAEELGLPVIIHTRPSLGSGDAYDDMYRILKKYVSESAYPAFHCILHCYQGDTEITRQFLELPNIYFSFSGSITYPVKKALIGTQEDSAEVVKLIPLERLFTETDCPFLAPQIKRGTRNEPAYMAFTVDAVCRLKKCSLVDLERRLNENWEKVFGV